MKSHYFFSPFFIVFILWIGFIGCRDNSGPELEKGRIKIITITQGENDEGYDILIQGEQQTHVAANDTLISENLNDGMYKVELLKLPEKCSVIGVNPVTVEVEDAQDVMVTFEVNCEETQMTTGSFEVITNTTPENSGYSFTLHINGIAEYDIAANDTLTFDNQQYGSYTLKLNEVPDNCTVDGENPQLAQIENEDKVSVYFDVICTINGSLEVITTTSVINSEKIYTFNFKGEHFEIGANDTVLIEKIDSGDYQLEMFDLPGNCLIRDENPRVVTITNNSTSSSEFQVFCQTIFDYKFILKSTQFEERTDLYFLYPDGQRETITQTFGSIIGPKLSPDGSKIAFRAVPPHVFDYELYLMNSDGSNIRKITDYPADPEIYKFVWAPDGESLLFSGRVVERETASIFSIDTDGSDLIQLTENSDNSDLSPSWAPDGSKIVFSRRKGDSADIYLMDPDGSNVTNITNSPDRFDAIPHWTPDGKKIYFISLLVDDETTLIYDMTSSQVTELLDSEGDRVRWPVWSPDGSKIAYLKPENKEDDSRNNIYVMNVDGSHSKKLTEAGYLTENHSPVWSPNGSKIAFERSDWGIIHSFVMNADGTEMNNLWVEGCCFIWLPLD
jgi:TolB protein